MARAAERRRAGRGWSWLLLLAVGCQVVEVTPVPIRGEIPRAIVVWPFVAAAYAAETEALLDGVAAAIAKRGYRTTSWQVAREMLREVTVAPSPDWQRVREASEADAAMQLVVREFAAAGTRPLRDAHWDLEWRLVSLPSGSVIWSHAQRGSWVAPRDTADPHRALDAEPDVVPIGGDRRIVYRDGRELLAALHQLAMAHLPARSR